MLKEDQYEGKQAGTEKLLENILENVCTAIDYPIHSSVAIRLMQSGISFNKERVPPVERIYRLLDAFSMLFSVTEEVHR
jgi:hypothetical protein